MAKAKTSPFQQRYAGWGPILRELERGKHPDAATMAAKLKTMQVDGLPELVKQHIIALLKGSVPKKRGRRRQDDFKDHALNVHVEARFTEHLKRLLKVRDAEGTPKKGTPKKEIPKKGTRTKGAMAALAATAKEFHRSVEWVKDRVYPDRLLRSK